MHPYNGWIHLQHIGIAVALAYSCHFREYSFVF